MQRFQFNTPRVLKLLIYQSVQFLMAMISYYITHRTYRYRTRVLLDYANDVEENFHMRRIRNEFVIKAMNGWCSNNPMILFTIILTIPLQGFCTICGNHCTLDVKHKNGDTFCFERMKMEQQTYKNIIQTQNWQG